MKQTVTVVAFGDSITHATHQAPDPGWTEILSLKLQSCFPAIDINVINAGVGGNTSREGLHRIDDDVLSHRPDFVCVEFGNDMTFDPDRQVSIEEYIANFDQIKAKVAKCSGGSLIILTFPPIIDQWNQFADHEFYKSRGGQDAWQEQYRKQLRKFAQTHQLALADIDLALREKMNIHGPGEFILPDGVHITARGNQVIAECVLGALSEEIGKFLTAGTKEK